MGKVWIVLKSEFVRRVRNKWFVIGTLLAPLGLLAVTVLPGMLAYISTESGERTLAVIDETGRLFQHMSDEAPERVSLLLSRDDLAAVRGQVEAGRFDGYLLLPSTLIEGIGSATYVTDGGMGTGIRLQLDRLVNRAVDRERLLEANVPPEVLEALQQRVEVRSVRIAPEGEVGSDPMLSSIAGYIMGFIIYIAVFIYGAMVMHGVMEEKTSRVVEVMASSVRPFDLLLGKVLGVGAMGLLQMLAWLVLLIGGAFVVSVVMAMFFDPSAVTAVEMGEEIPVASFDFGSIAIPWGLIAWFILFFLGGYLLYASLFAAVGSAVEQPQDAQTLMLPVTLPIIIPIIFIAFVIESPNAPLSVILSLIPFFSPILMVVRLGSTSVPFYEVAASFASLVGAFFGAIWLSGRIYRIGILMYGKKASFRDLARWVRM
jgi:ABC-2 type transport system permease protein